MLFFFVFNKSCPPLRKISKIQMMRRLSTLGACETIRAGSCLAECSQSGRSGWSGFGKALTWDPSQMITCHPKKIPKYLLKGGVVQFCPKSPCTRFTTLAQTQADSTLKSQLSTINTLDTNRKEASVDSPPNINYFSSFHHLIIDID